MAKTTSAGNSGASAVFLLFLTFLILKLTHFIDWSWWWIIAPFWVPIVLFIAFLIVALFYYVFIKKEKEEL